MSHVALTTVSAAVALSIGLVPAAALPGAGAAGAPEALNDINMVETIACARYGWRGWGVYPGCFRAPVYVVPGYVVTAPAYAPAPVYVAPPRRCWVHGAWHVC